MEFFFSARGCSLEAFFLKQNSHYWPLTYPMKGFLTEPLNQHIFSSKGNVSRHFAVYRDHRPGPLSRLPQTARARIRELFDFDLSDG